MELFHFYQVGTTKAAEDLVSIRLARSNPSSDSVPDVFY